MDIKNLIHMANQIGVFFEAMPDREEALLGISNHLHSFWEPRMRKQLLSHVDEQNGAGLSPVVMASLRAHRNKLSPQF